MKEQGVWSKKLRRTLKFRVPLDSHASEGELAGNLKAPVCLFVGAGLPKAFGAPLARELFRPFDVAGVKWKSKLIDRVIRIAPANGDTDEVEKFIRKAYDSEFGRKLPFSVLVKFIGLHIMLSTADAGAKWHARRGHHVCGFFKRPEHTELATKLFGGIGDKISLITTNYDVLIERMLSPQHPKDRSAPGFSYDGIATELKALGDPGETIWGRPVLAAGSVALCKLHGSLSWRVSEDKLLRMTDCSPAHAGDSYIVPPMPEKEVLPLLENTWRTARELLHACRCLVFVGYSLPKYDVQIYSLYYESRYPIR